MKKLLVLLLVVYFSSCEPQQKQTEKSPYWVCNCKEQEKIADFVGKSLKPANNMSDEEMEDVIASLYKVGVKTFCRQKLLIIQKSYGAENIDWGKQKLDSCESVIAPFYGF